MLVLSGNAPISCSTCFMPGTSAKLRQMSRLKATGKDGKLDSNRRLSIVAVAEEANVSIATVSRVLNDNITVQPELVKRVRRAIEKTGYLPNVSARALSSGRSRLFGVIISNLTNPFFPELLQSFEEYAVALGYEVLVASTAYDLQRMTHCIDRMLERKVDGVAVMTFGIEGPLLNKFANRGVPLVFMDEAPPSPMTTAIQVDYQAGIEQAIQHLAVLGHRKIGFVSGPEHHISVANRSRAVSRAMHSVGLSQSPESVFIGDHSVQSGEAALAHFLAQATPPTAILCSNDLSAIGVMHAADSMGLCVPDDMSLIGFDGIEFGAYTVPPLTSVMMSRREIAQAAVNVLWRKIEGEAITQAPIRTRLLVRRTTGIPRGTMDDLIRPELPLVSIG